MKAERWEKLPARRIEDSLFAICACRPISFTCLLFLCALVCTGSLNAPVRFCILASLALVFFVLFFLFYARGARRICLCCFCALLAFTGAFFIEWRAYEHTEKPSELLYLRGEKAQIEGSIREISYRDDNRATLVLETVSVRGEVVRVPLVVHTYDAELLQKPLRRGDLLRGTVMLIKPQTTLYLSDEVTLCRKEGAYLAANLKDGAQWEASEGERPFWETLRETLAQTLSELKSYGIAEAVLLGERGALDPTLKTALAQTGTSHLFALSGLHLSLIVGSLYYFLRLLTVHRRINLFLCGAFCVGYILMTGAPLSLLRAGGMMLLFGFYQFFRLRVGSVQNLFLAMTIIVCFDGSALFDPALQLSFLSTLGILLCVPRVQSSLEETSVFGALMEQRFLRPLVFLLRAITLSFVMTLSAVFFTFPLIAKMFGTLSLFSPLTNFVLAAIFQPALILCLLFCVAALCRVGFLSGVFARLCDVLFSFLREATLFFSRVLPEGILVDRPYLVVVTVLMVLCVLFCLRFRVRTRYLFAVPLLCAGVFMSCGVVDALLHKNDDTLLFSNTYMTQSLMIRSRGSVVLLEAKKAGSADVSDFCEALSRMGIQKADALVLPALSVTVINRARTLSERFSLANLWVPAEASLASPELYQMLCDFCAEADIRLSLFEANEPFSPGGSLSVTSHSPAKGGFGYGIEGANARVFYAYGMCAKDEYDIVFCAGNAVKNAPSEPLFVGVDQTLNPAQTRILRLDVLPSGKVCAAY